jgi:hypothetical protein
MKQICLSEWSCYAYSVVTVTTRNLRPFGFVVHIWVYTYIAEHFEYPFVFWTGLQSGRQWRLCWITKCLGLSITHGIRIDIHCHQPNKILSYWIRVLWWSFAWTIIYLKANSPLHFVLYIYIYIYVWKQCDVGLRNYSPESCMRELSKRFAFSCTEIELSRNKA